MLIPSKMKRIKKVGEIRCHIGTFVDFIIPLLENSNYLLEIKIVQNFDTLIEVYEYVE